MLTFDFGLVGGEPDDRFRRGRERLYDGGRSHVSEERCSGSANINMQVDSHGDRGGSLYQDGWLTYTERSAGA